MKLMDLLENPLVDLQIVGDKSQSYSARERDMRLWSSAKAVEKIKLTWAGVPWNVRAYILNLQEIPEFNPKTPSKFPPGGNRKAIYALTFHGKELTKQKLTKDFGQEIADIVWPASDETTVLFTHNTSMKNEMPLTGWTIAHRMYHAATFSGKQYAILHDEPLMARLRAYNSSLGHRFTSDEYLSDDGIAAKVFTFKSARENKINTNLEIMPELFAQWLLTGKNPINPDVGPEWQKKFEAEMVKLDLYFGDLMTKLKGKVVVL